MSAENNSPLKSFFKKIYWRQHPEAALRYWPVVNAIKKSKLEKNKVLEIGSGSLGIVPYFKREIDGIDIDFTGPQTKLLNKIKGKAYEIPFQANTYDVTISVDVLEHLKKSQREAAVYEMLRVSKKMAIIVVPTGKYSEKQDLELEQHWNKVFGYKNQFLNEHVTNGLPKTEEIFTYIDNSLRKLKKKAKIQSFANLNLNVRKLLMLTWITKNKLLYYFYLKGLLPFIPILRHFNFGKTYRHVFVIKFTS